jgi:hypothetical protein
MLDNVRKNHLDELPEFWSAGEDAQVDQYLAPDVNRYSAPAFLQALEVLPRLGQALIHRINDIYNNINMDLFDDQDDDMAIAIDADLHEKDSDLDMDADSHDATDWE